MGKWTENEKNCSRDFWILGAVSVCVCGRCFKHQGGLTRHGRVQFVSGFFPRLHWSWYLLLSAGLFACTGTCCKLGKQILNMPLVVWVIMELMLCNFFITPGQSSCRILVPQEDLPAQGPSAGSLGGNSYVLHGYRRLFFAFVCVLTTHNGYLM